MFVQYSLIRIFFMALIVAYIFGFIHTPYCGLCANPLIQFLMLICIIQLSYFDLPMALLLTVAFLIYINIGEYVSAFLGWAGLSSARTDLYGQRLWNDETTGSDPTGYNVDRYCENNWSFQCQGMDTQGLTVTQGFTKSRDFGAAEF